MPCHGKERASEGSFPSVVGAKILICALLMLARPRIPVPEPRQLAEALKQLVTIEGVASRFEVSFTTANKWVFDSGLNSVYESPAHQRLLKGIISEGPKGS